MTTAIALEIPREMPPPVGETSFANLDASVTRVASKKDDWIGVGIPERIAYLKKLTEGILAVAERWVEGGCALKGIPHGSSLAGEEWLAGPMATLRNVRLLIESLEQGGQPKANVRVRADGQSVAHVLPLNLQDRAIFSGMTAEVWIEPGKPASQGAIYRATNGEKAPGKVSLVLGGGNVSSIPPMDVLYKLFVENEVVVLKMNPVNAFVGAHLEQAFRALIDDGYLAIVYGGGDVGAHLAKHPKIDALHITGSDRTYDAIVWGSDPVERARRKETDAPLNTRPFSAELGCVTPILVVPGPWSHTDLEFHARHVASMVAQNASFNCNAAKVLVTAKSWLQRDTFLANVEKALAAIPARNAYYPGAQARYRGFIDHYAQAKVVGKEGEGVVPWTIIPDVSPDAGEYALTNEAFCGVLAETSLAADDPREFLEKATAFANDRCWGTLSVCLLVHPSTAETYAGELDRAVANLRYGGIGVNCWPGMIYALGVTSWGAFPGHDRKDIQSGSGVVHNAMLFDHPQKSVVRAPFRMRPKPPYFADNKNMAEIGRKLVGFEAAPSWGKLVGVALAAIRG
jgi:hypothetical protein